MTTISGSLAASGVSAALSLRPKESAVVTLSVAAGQTFNGTVSIERSASKGLAWQAATDSDGNALSFAGATQQNAIATRTILNDSRLVQQYRARALVNGGSDAVVYSLAGPAGSEIVDVLLVDSHNRPILGLRDDDRLQFLVGGAVVPGVSTLVSERVDDVTIAAADIVGTGAGQLGHANGYPLVVGAGADLGLELVSALLVYDRATATYGAGGNLTVNVEAGGAALTGLVSAANSIGAGADKVALFRPLSTAAELIAANKGINLVSSAAFTNPGTAAGVARVRVRYRLHTLGLS